MFGAQMCETRLRIRGGYEVDHLIYIKDLEARQR